MKDGDFRPGLWRHFKGGLYTAVCLVTHHETREPMVLYVSHTYGGMNVRPLNGWAVSGDDNRCSDPDAWTGNVPCPACEHEPRVDDAGQRVRGCTECLGKGHVPRFTFVGALPSDTPIEQR